MSPPSASEDPRDHPGDHGEAGSRREPDPERPPGGLPEHPPCPFCGRRETHLRSEFGAHASVSTYWCRPCHSPFEFIRWSGGRTP